jgi:hypothetical protein
VAGSRRIECAEEGRSYPVRVTSQNSKGPPCSGAGGFLSTHPPTLFPSFQPARPSLTAAVGNFSGSSYVVKPPDRPSEKNMTKTFACAIAALSLLAITGSADAKGCIKGAIVGGVAGHVAGHHGVLGAAAGCAIGHHEANKPSNPQPSTTGSAPRSSPK